MGCYPYSESFVNIFRKLMQYCNPCIFFTKKSKTKQKINEEKESLLENQNNNQNNSSEDSDGWISIKINCEKNES